MPIRKYDITMLKTAILWSKHSTCKRRQVGAVLAKDNRIISIGYNGTVSGTSNECEELAYNCGKCGNLLVFKDHIPLGVGKYQMVCPKCDRLSMVNYSYFKDVTKSTVIHAEQNTLMYAAKAGISTSDATLYSTDLPCPDCAKLLIQAGIKRVVYIKDYTSRDGLELFNQVGIIVDNYNNIEE